MEFLKDYVDLTWLEKLADQRIFSITELLEEDNKRSAYKESIRNKRMPRKYARPGPREWYIKK